jgi:hypothetical protein
MGLCRSWPSTSPPLLRGWQQVSFLEFSACSHARLGWIQLCQSTHDGASCPCCAEVRLAARTPGKPLYRYRSGRDISSCSFRAACGDARQPWPWASSRRFSSFLSADAGDQWRLCQHGGRARSYWVQRGKAATLMLWPCTALYSGLTSSPPPKHRTRAYTTHTHHHTITHYHTHTTSPPAQACWSGLLPPVDGGQRSPRAWR